jgi:hypothetical protein
MANKNKSEGLEIQEDMEFQEKEWAFERVGRWVILLVILAALAGLFGWGPASQASNASGAYPVWVEYQRFARFKAPITLTAHFEQLPVVEGEAVFWLDNEYMKNFRIYDIHPTPDSVDLGEQHVIYHFKIDPHSPPDAVLFHLQPETFGLIRGRIGAVGEAGNPFSQWIYP